MHATRLHRCSDKTYRQNRITSDHRHLRFQTAISHSRSEVTNVAERLTICVTSMQEFALIRQAYGKRRIVSAAPDVRPATANLWPHREQQRQARRRRSPRLLGRLSPEVACLDWARTFADSSSVNASPNPSSTWCEGQPLGVWTLPDGVIDLKQVSLGLTLAQIAMFAAYGEDSERTKRPRIAKKPAQF